MSFQDVRGFAGDVEVDTAYEILAKDERAVLIDVRTQAEWQYVGVPDLSGLDRPVVFKQWQTYPAMTVSGDFVETLTSELRRLGADEASPLLFLCRSGVRSKAAAIAMTGAGWTQCYNVAQGFEGALDETHHRNSSGGWRARGLPWRQT